jgi:hypothetical protein
VAVGLFDNPITSTDPVPSIPRHSARATEAGWTGNCVFTSVLRVVNSSPDCSVRPQTIVEIKRMRLDAARIAQMIQTEASSF